MCQDEIKGGCKYAILYHSKQEYDTDINNGCFTPMPTVHKEYYFRG